MFPVEYYSPAQIKEGENTVWDAMAVYCFEMTMQMHHPQNDNANMLMLSRCNVDHVHLFAKLALNPNYSWGRWEYRELLQIIPMATQMIKRNSWQSTVESRNVIHLMVRMEVRVTQITMAHCLGTIIVLARFNGNLHVIVVEIFNSL